MRPDGRHIGTMTDPQVRPLDANSLLSLAVLLASQDAPQTVPAIADRVAHLAAPGFPADRPAVERAAARLRASGHLSETPEGYLRASEAGRALATDLSGRLPGSACDATRVCLLLRLCLDGVMPAGNREILVARLLAGQAPENCSTSG